VAQEPPAAAEAIYLSGSQDSTAPEILRVGGEVSAPVKIEGPKPEYTDIAHRARVQGVVIVQATIDENGDVTDAKVLKGLPMGLDQKAIEAVHQWKFQPATRNGEPVKVYHNLTIEFRL